jgi:two-component system, LytTR family, sensor kinase
VDVPAEPQILLPPMLFVPFVENAFKHGIGIDTGNFIHIHLSVREKKLIFDLKNSMPARKRPVQSTQTGLDNVKKRLELLFPGQHNLRIAADAARYHTHLDIFIN